MLMGVEKKLFASFALLQFLLLISNAAFSQEITPLLVESAQYSFIDSHTISSSSGGMSELRINLSIPEEMLISDSSHYYTIERNLEGNRYLIVEAKNPPSPFIYSLNATILAEEQVLTSLEADWQVGPSMQKYARAAGAVKSDDPFFASLAKNITKGAHSDFEKISALAEWVNAYVEYDLSYIDKNAGVYEILESKRGVCGDYSLLFITLARSLGYPARFANGYAYSDEQHIWIGHAWAEVYLGKWVGVDPTWLEVGHIDATHITFSRTATNEYSTAEVSAKVSAQGAQLLWDKSGEVNLPAENLFPKKINMREKISGFELEPSAYNLQKGDKFIAYLKYPAGDYRLLRLSLLPCKTEGEPIVRLEREITTITTSPAQPSYAIWEGEILQNIDSNTIYKCPLSLGADYLQPSAIYLNITEKQEGRLLLDAGTYKSLIRPGEMQKISATLSPFGAGERVFVIEKNMKISALADASGSVEFEFEAGESGTHTAYVFSRNSNLATLTYEVDAGAGAGEIEIIPQAPLFEGEGGSVLIRAPDSYGASSLKWSWDGQSGTSQFFGSTAQANFTPSTYGTHLFRAVLLDKGNGEIYRQSIPLEAMQKSYATVEGIRVINYNNEKTLVLLAVSATGQIEKLWLEINGSEFELIAGTENELILPLAEHQGTIYWEGKYGMKGSLPVIVRAPGKDDKLVIEPGLMQAQEKYPLAQLFMQSIAALIILTIAYFLARKKFGHKSHFE
ncbi:hypothetical protein COU37_00435 [Candidatus Micrarchaeota archaeon CG10_big_fil_rev_8_21_14_0_10_45_29]|nr:MAG: hypothetical protein COU37_00435 [Candidatus Micrarchaeota archaeon CG10_big_fil_rev_8_21_14_0_10_45_29]